MTTAHTPGDRRRGALLGLAIGDALGATTEFDTPGPLAWVPLLTGPHRQVTGGGRHAVRPGMVTDDTQMACCLAGSITACTGYDPADAARRYVAWVDRSFAAGAQTIAVLRCLAHGGDPLTTGLDVWRETGRQAAANGSLMRAAPIGALIPDEHARRRASLTDSAITHADPRCTLACACFNSAIAAGISGADAKAMHEVASTEMPLAAELAEEIWPDESRAIAAATSDLAADLAAAAADEPGFDSWLAIDGRALGFVRVAFRLAFWELLHAPDPKAALIDVVNRGGDADTNAAITGALLGACHGVAAFPRAWVRAVLTCPAPSPWHPGGEFHPAMLDRACHR